MSIIVTRNGQPTQRIKAEFIQLEVSLQDYIVDHPEALPLTDLRENLKFLIAREFSNSSGSIDAVGLDDESNLYLIETKLYRNSDQRRVLAQVLDYGAALWKHEGGPRSFRERLEKAARGTLGADLVPKIADAFGIELEEAEALLTSAEQQIRKGSFRFVVLMDRIDDRLKNLISFINENSRFDVYGVQLEVYSFDGYTVTIPKLYGAEARKAIAGGGSSNRRSRWDKTSYFEDARSKLTPEQAESLRELYEFAIGHADRVTWGSGFTVGSFNLKYDQLSPTKSILTVYSDGGLDFNFKWLHDVGEPLPKEARGLAEHLAGLEGWSLPPNYAETYPRVPLETWVSQVDAIIEALKGSMLRRSL